MRPEEKFVRLPDGFMRLSMRQLVASRELSRSEGVDYEESYALGTLQTYYLTCFNDRDYI